MDDSPGLKKLWIDSLSMDGGLFDALRSDLRGRLVTVSASAEDHVLGALYMIPVDLAGGSGKRLRAYYLCYPAARTPEAKRAVLGGLIARARDHMRSQLFDLVYADPPKEDAQLYLRNGFRPCFSVKTCFVGSADLSGLPERRFMYSLSPDPSVVMSRFFLDTGTITPVWYPGLTNFMMKLDSSLVDLRFGDGSDEAVAVCRKDGSGRFFLYFRSRSHTTALLPYCIRLLVGKGVVGPLDSFPVEIPTSYDCGELTYVLTGGGLAYCDDATLSALKSADADPGIRL